MVTAPAFWYRPRLGPAAALLAPAGAAWGAVAGRRMRRAPLHRAGVPVLCVGNFTVGGEGKTPTALALAEIVRAAGLAPGFLTRGFGGREKGPLVVAETESAGRVGDEALLLARQGVTVLSHDRPPGARLLEAAGAEAIVMDDGFQNPSLAKDFSLVVADAQFGIGNGRVVPAGPLRAPLRVQLRQADGLLIIGEGPARPSLLRIAARAGLRVFGAKLVPPEAARWQGERVLAYAGIGRPEKFFAALEAAGAKLAGRIAFPDHHVWTETEARTLLGHAGGGSVRLVTTEKDLARLAGATGVLAELRERSEAFPVRLVFDEPGAVAAVVRAVLNRVRLRVPSAP
ncbi:MAG: tetraacyldisaccharide 4'-kinase [Bauldia sp.]